MRDDLAWIKKDQIFVPRLEYWPSDQAHIAEFSFSTASVQAREGVLNITKKDKPMKSLEGGTVVPVFLIYPTQEDQFRKFGSCLLRARS
jgi:hypothetical protein